MKNTLLTMAVLVSTLINFAQAQAPRTLNYQGHLTTDGITPVTDGTYNITFTLYDAASAGNNLWFENQATVAVTNGDFQVVLGLITPINLGFDIQYWLGITVSPDPEMSQRVQLTASAYAMGLNTQSSIIIGQSANGSVAGELRYNGSQFEGYNGATWNQLDAAAGISLPYAGSLADSTTLFSISNTGLGGAGSFMINNPSNTITALYTSTNSPNGLALDVQNSGTSETATTAVFRNTNGGASGATVKVLSTSNAAGVHAEATNGTGVYTQSNGGTPLVANTLSGVGNIAEFQSSASTVASVDFNGKGTFSGGLQSGGTTVHTGLSVQTAGTALNPIGTSMIQLDGGINTPTINAGVEGQILYILNNSGNTIVIGPSTVTNNTVGAVMYFNGAWRTMN